MSGPADATERAAEGILDGLPKIYAAALLLREAGCDEPSIARILHLEPAGVESLLAIGGDKLRRITASVDARCS